MKKIFARFWEANIHRPNAKNSKGMTLIEIIIVIALLATLMAILATNVMKTAESAKEDQARIAMQSLAQALQMYRVHNYKYPTTEQGLDALLRDPGSTKRWRGPYVESEQKLNDPWGNRLEYESDGTVFRMTSMGTDGQLGTANDIHFPERDTEETGE